MESGSFKSFGSGFASGAVSSLVSSGVQALGKVGTFDTGFSDFKGGTIKSSFASRNPILMKAIMITSGGLSGGFSSAIAGGNFWQGFKQGVIVAGLNHALHDVVMELKGGGDKLPKSTTKRTATLTEYKRKGTGLNQFFTKENVGKPYAFGVTETIEENTYVSEDLLRKTITKKHHYYTLKDGDGLFFGEGDINLSESISNCLPTTYDYMTEYTYTSFYKVKNGVVLGINHIGESADFYSGSFNKYTNVPFQYAPYELKEAIFINSANRVISNLESFIGIAEGLGKFFK